MKLKHKFQLQEIPRRGMKDARWGLPGGDSSTQTTLLRGFLMQLLADDMQQRRIHAPACPKLQKSGSWFCYLTQLHKFVRYCVATWCKVQEL